MSGSTGTVPLVNSLTSAPDPGNQSLTYNLDFAPNSVIKLTASDFNLSSKERITLRDERCILVLFYVTNQQSIDAAHVWAIAASQTAGPVFGAINMIDNRSVAEAFTAINTDGANPYHWAGLRQYPFVLVYRNGIPTSFYQGQFEVQAIIDYALTLACKAGTYEQQQIYGSMTADTRFTTGDNDKYFNFPGETPVVRQTSTQYQANTPIRNYNRTVPGTATAAAQGAPVQGTTPLPQTAEGPAPGGELNRGPEVARPFRSTQ